MLPWLKPQASRLEPDNRGGFRQSKTAASRRSRSRRAASRRGKLQIEEAQRGLLPERKRQAEADQRGALRQSSGQIEADQRGALLGILKRRGSKGGRQSNFTLEQQATAAKICLSMFGFPRRHEWHARLSQRWETVMQENPSLLGVPKPGYNQVYKWRKQITAANRSLQHHLNQSPLQTPRCAATLRW